MKRRGNFSIFSNHSYFAEGKKVLLSMTIAFILGALLQGAILYLINLILKNSYNINDYKHLFLYPVMFIPAFFYVSFNAMFSRQSNKESYDIDSYILKKRELIILIPVLIIATICLSFICEPIISLLPPMPEIFKKALEEMLKGNVFTTFISISILAPICEEWLCRGIILRSLLHGEKPLSPLLSIFLSALFFAFIHLNPWQGIPALILGMLFGLVYYVTGSLKLTMLMHFSNNTFALIISKLLPDSTINIEGFKDMLPKNIYYIIFTISSLIVIFSIIYIYKLNKEKIQPLLEN